MERFYRLYKGYSKEIMCTPLKHSHNTNAYKVFSVDHSWYDDFNPEWAETLKQLYRITLPDKKVMFSKRNLIQSGFQDKKCESSILVSLKARNYSLVQKGDMLLFTNERFPELHLPVRTKQVEGITLYKLELLTDSNYCDNIQYVLDSFFSTYSP